MDYIKAAEPEYQQQPLHELYSIDVAIVVNNVDVDGLDHYKLAKKQILNMINVNSAAVSLMNLMFIPRMLDRYNKLGHKLDIVNVAFLEGRY